MRNSTAVRAGVPAPFTGLEPLRRYLDLLETVVDNPTVDNLATYRDYDENVYTPIAYIHRNPWGERTYEPCILWDGVGSCVAEGHDDAHRRNAARGVINSLATGIADSGAFPCDLVPEAYKMLDDALVRLLGISPEDLTFARKRMGLGLLNVWVDHTVYRSSWAPGDPEEMIDNIHAGWRQWGAPYGGIFFAKLAGRIGLRRYY